MDMAEKDEAEGWCPACRTPYNKEKIVGMAANCERLTLGKEVLWSVREGAEGVYISYRSRYHSTISEVRTILAVFSRAQVSAPSGFLLPSRAPPPGFVSHEKMEPTFGAISWNSSLDASSSTRNLYQAPPTENIGTTGDIEFMDPAILEVGKGILPVGPNNAASLDMRSNFSSQLSAFENEPRLQLLMQRSLSPLQNHRLANLGDGIAPFSDAYRIPSRITKQTMTSYAPPSQQSRTSLIMLNGHGIVGTKFRVEMAWAWWSYYELKD